MKNQPFTIAGVTLEPGERKSLQLSAPSLYAEAPMNIPVHIINGKQRGPRLFLFAAVHGDEINGVEIIRRFLKFSGLKNLHGTLIAVPVANVHGFITLSRYLPDRRDLNRAFPGSKTGSMTARIAYLFMQEIISKCTHGIDLHTGNIHSENLPHVRTNMDVQGAARMAKAFNTPVVLDAKIRDGSIRQAATELNIPLLVYEAGEALRFNDLAIRIGLRGIVNVLCTLGMLDHAPLTKKDSIKTRTSTYSSWVRAPQSGIFHPLRTLGTDIEEGEKLGFIADPFSKKEIEFFSPLSGIIIGRTTLPLVNEGDALLHIAKLKGKETVTSQINELQNYFIEHPFDFY